MRNFARLSRLAYKAASWNDTVSYVANVMVRPLCVMLLFAMTARVSLGDAVADAFVIGSAAFAIPWVIRGGMLDGFESERWQGTLGTHLVSTGGRLLPFLARGVLHAPNAVVAVCFSMLGAVLFLDYSLSGLNWPAALVSLLAMVLSVSGICLLLGTFCIVLRNSIFVGNTAMIFFLTMSGGYIPREDLPVFAQQIAEVIPMAHGFEALRGAFAGATIGSVWQDLAAEFAIAVVYTLAGYLLFRFLERFALRSGTYDLS